MGKWRQCLRDGAHVRGQEVITVSRPCTAIVLLPKKATELEINRRGHKLNHARCAGKV